MTRKRRKERRVLTVTAREIGAGVRRTETAERKEETQPLAAVPAVIPVLTPVVTPVLTAADPGAEIDLRKLTERRKTKRGHPRKLPPLPLEREARVEMIRRCQLRSETGADQEARETGVSVPLPPRYTLAGSPGMSTENICRRYSLHLARSRILSLAAKE